MTAADLPIATTPMARGSWGWPVSFVAHAALIAGVAWLAGHGTPPSAPAILVEIVALEEAAPEADTGAAIEETPLPVAGTSEAPPIPERPPPAPPAPAAVPTPVATAAAPPPVATKPPPSPVEPSRPAEATAPVPAAVPKVDPEPLDIAAPRPRPRPTAVATAAPPPRPRPLAVSADIPPPIEGKPVEVFLTDPGPAKRDISDHVDSRHVTQTPPHPDPGTPQSGGEGRKEGASPPSAASAGEQTASLPAASAPPGFDRRAANRAPRYPFLAREKGWEGRVVLAVVVAPDGSAREVTIKRSSRHDMLDDAAVDAVRSWRFTPARRFGQPVAGTIDVPVTFRLTE